MMWSSLLSRAFLLCVCVWGSWVEPQIVQGTANTPVTFTVQTRRTAAGQWQAEVDVRHGQGLHDLVVSHRTESCGVAEPSVRSRTTITANDSTRGEDKPRSACGNMFGCARLSSRSLEFKCGSSEHAAPCKAVVPVGTTASMACKPGYIIRRPAIRETTCLETGDWSEPLLDCMKEPPGYEFFPKLGWYQLYMIGNTFQQAKGVCEFDGGSLGVVDSPGELEVLTALINRSRPAINIQHQHDIYMGVRRREGGQEYVSLSAAFGCTNRFDKEKQRSFHKFPLKKETLTREWCIACKREGFVPTKHSLICGDHFQPSYK